MKEQMMLVKVGIRPSQDWNEMGVLIPRIILMIFAQITHLKAF